jgi:DNA excision repair protein ERCC-1
MSMVGIPSVRDGAAAGKESVRRTEQLLSGRVAVHGASNAPATSYTGYTGAELLVNECQKKNPMLHYIRLVRWKVATITPDFIFGPKSCGLFLSLRYHLLHENYIFRRIKEIKGMFKLRVLFLLIDVVDSETVLAEVTNICLSNDMTLISVWSEEECARYLETYKAYEKKGIDDIKPRVHKSLAMKGLDFLTTVRSINKSDVMALYTNFKTLKEISTASMEELALCPGLGPRKVRYLYEALHGPIPP